MIRRSLMVAVAGVPLVLVGCGKKASKAKSASASASMGSSAGGSASAAVPEKEKKGFLGLGEMKMPKMPKMFEGETPEEKARKQIAKVLAAQGDAKYFNEISDLYDLAAGLNWDGRRLLNEVLDYAPMVKGEQQQGKYVQLLNTLQIPKTAIVSTAAPRLGSGSSADDEAYRMLLRNAAPPDPRGTPDFSHFRPYLEVNQQQPPVELVLWMFERDPGAALRELTAAYGRGMSREQIAQALWTDHLVADQVWRSEFGFTNPGQADPATARQLDELSRSEAWWMRAYVAVVMNKHAGMRQGEIVQRLSGDAHPVVKRAVERGK